MPTQHLTIPFTYEAGFVPRRARRRRDVLVLDYAVVLLHELAPESFPVAARAATGRPLGEGAPLDDLRFDGRHFYRLWRETREDLPAGQLQARVTGDGGRHFGSSPFRQMQNPIGQGQLIETYGDGEFLDDNREERLAAFRNEAARLRICGGKVWVRTGEPCYQFNHGGFSGGPWLSVKFIDPGRLPDLPGNYCRADRVGAFWAERVGDGSGPECYDRLEIVMPSALRLSFEGPALMKEVSDVLEAIAERLAPASVEDFGVYAGLRDALAASPKAPGEDLVSAIEVLLGCETWRDRTHGLDRSYRRWRADLQGVAASPEPEPPPRAPRR